MTRVKICGIKEEPLALVAAKAGADFFGLIFAPSRRQVTPEKASRILAAVKQDGHPLQSVGVFVNRPAPEVNKIARDYGLDRVQLSGDEPWEYCLEIDRPLIKVVRVGRTQGAEEISDLLARGEEALKSQEHVYLLEPKMPGRYGGTGRLLDWKLAQQMAGRFPVILAGGLTPENVARAVKNVAPWGVDVSSGVEVGGAKHAARIRAFINAVRKADAER
jgi:phosphoribosylanthranilate isomerase